MKVELNTEELRTACYEYLRRRIGGEPQKAPDFFTEEKYLDSLKVELLWKAKEEETSE
jgi:hypothetical protein